MSVRDSLLFVAVAALVAFLIVGGCRAVIVRLIPSDGIGMSDLVRR